MYFPRRSAADVPTQLIVARAYSFHPTMLKKFIHVGLNLADVLECSGHGKHYLCLGTTWGNLLGSRHGKDGQIERSFMIPDRQDEITSGQSMKKHDKA